MPVLIVILIAVLVLAALAASMASSAASAAQAQAAIEAARAAQVSAAGQAASSMALAAIVGAGLMLTISLLALYAVYQVRKRKAASRSLIVPSYPGEQDDNVRAPGQWVSGPNANWGRLPAGNPPQSTIDRAFERWIMLQMMQSMAALPNIPQRALPHQPPSPTPQEGDPFQEW